MDEQIKTEWVKRLRSGDYKQGMGSLNADNKFCCHGVLCEIAVENNIIEPPVDIGHYVMAYGEYSGMPPITVRRWARLGDFEVTQLAKLNDKGWSFNEIADYIEKRIP